MKHSRFILRLSLGLVGSAAPIFACGDSESSDAMNAAGASGSTNSPTGNGNTSGSSGSGATSGNPNTEGNPGTVSLDPNRDPTVPVNLIESGAVNCGGGGDFCVAPSLVCCVAGGGMFSCAPTAEACPEGTTSSAACSSSVSCGSGQVCCSTGGGFGGPGGGDATTTCETSCADGADQLCLEDSECADGGACNNGTCGPAACTTASCGTGELCCRPLGGGGGAVPACAAPGTDGACPLGQREVCEQDGDCPEGNTCDPLFGGGGGGVTLCTPPPCTPGNCPEGQACCVGGGLGGTPVCAPAIESGGCQGTSRLACVTDTECAPTPDTECLLGPNGMGALSCREPPDPPVAGDAGAPDGG